MIIQVADHPLVCICEFKVGLPETVAMLPLEPTLTPNPSRLGDGIVQSSLDENAMNRSMTDRRDPPDLVITQVSFDLVWSPMFAASQFQDKVHRAEGSPFRKRIPRNRRYS